MDKTFIAWTVPNWITIFLMWLLAFMIFSGTVQILRRMKTEKGEEDA